MRKILAIISAVGVTACSNAASVTWTNTVGDSDSTNTANWSPSVAVPGSADDIFINTSDTIGNGSGAPWSIRSVTLDSSKTSDITTGVGSLLIGAGGITLGANSNLTFNLGVVFNASSAITLASNSKVAFATGTDFASNYLVSTNFGSGATLTLDNSVQWSNGTMNFTGAVEANSIIVTGGLLDPGTLSKISINGFSVIQSSGFIVSAIPEPTTYAALFGAAALGMAAYRKRRVAA